MPANLIVALVLLGVEALKTYRAQQEKRAAESQKPEERPESPRG